MGSYEPPLFGTQKVNQAGHLEIGGCDTVALAEEFGTPLYVLDEQHVRERCRSYLSAFRALLPEVEVAYAGKALMCKAMCRLIQQEGMALDVASAGELYTALQAGFPAGRIKFHGNFKSDQELALAVGESVGRVVVDSLSEMERLSVLAQAAGKQADILLRVAPGIKTQTHTYIQTGQQDSKFGLGLATGAAREGVRLALELPGVKLRGLHSHIGSQLFGLDCFQKAAELMLEFMASIRDEFGALLGELDLGGGLGITYTNDDAPPSIEQLAQVTSAGLRIACEQFDYPLPKLILEPGRSIVGTAGTTLYHVGPVKEIPGVRTYVAVDGGLSDNPRPALYGAEYMAVVANKANQAPAEHAVRVAGKHCETDTLLPEVWIQPVAEGDVLAVFSTGAYNYAMASNYNRFCRPAMVLVNEGQADLIVRRETLDDVVAQDVVPERLA
ncbi:MAG TPA: diaminopimelate decarboxylase [Armatimonadota bacterium]|jgi:diaminopimelate decarboxylase